MADAAEPIGRAGTRARMTGKERRLQLVDVGRHLFAEKGFEGTSVEEIAAKAGVSKPVVYEHFGGKEGLYAVIVDREMEAIVGRIAARIATGTPRMRFEGAVVAFLTYAKEQPDGFAILTRDAPPGQSRRGMTNVITDLSERVGDIFEMELARIGMDKRVSPIYAHALIGMVTQVGLWWAENPQLPVDQVARHVAAMGWMGLRHLPTKPQLLGAKSPANREGG